MNDILRKKEVQKYFSPVYSTFSNHYRGLFSPARKEDVVKHCKYWIDELTESNLEPSEIPAIAESIKSSVEFSSKPPNPSQFIQFYNKSSGKSASNDDFTLAFELIFNSMRERYKYLWDKNADNSSSPTFDFWLEELKNENIQIESIKNIFNKIPSMPQYLTYPPAINEVLLMIKIESSDENIPQPHDAQEMCLSRSKDVHPIINYCRYALDIRKMEKKDFLKKFNSVYFDAVNRYLSGSLNLEKFKKDESIPNESKSMNKKDLIKSLDDLLNSL